MWLNWDKIRCWQIHSPRSICFFFFLTDFIFVGQFICTQIYSHEISNLGVWDEDVSNLDRFHMRLQWLMVAAFSRTVSTIQDWHLLVCLQFLKAPKVKSSPDSLVRGKRGRWCSETLDCGFQTDIWTPIFLLVRNMPVKFICVFLLICGHRKTYNQEVNQGVVARFSLK